MCGTASIARAHLRRRISFPSRLASFARPRGWWKLLAGAGLAQTIKGSAFRAAENLQKEITQRGSRGVLTNDEAEHREILARLGRWLALVGTKCEGASVKLRAIVRLSPRTFCLFRTIFAYLAKLHLFHAMGN